MANHTGLRENWVKFLAGGENPKGMVAQVPDETLVNYQGGESAVGGETDPRSLQAEQSFIQVSAYQRRRR